jgi:hypothetical protein
MADPIAARLTIAAHDEWRRKVKPEVVEMLVQAMRAVALVSIDASPRVWNERGGGNTQTYDRLTLEWLIDMGPQRWTDEYLRDAMEDVTGLRPSRQWVQRQRTRYRPR